MYVLYILPLSNKKKETLDGDVRVERQLAMFCFNFKRNGTKGTKGVPEKVVRIFWDIEEERY